MATNAPKAKFDYKPHPHIADRKKHKVANSEEILSEAGQRTLNQKLGLAITKRVGTMWAAYIFFALTLVSLPAVIMSGNLVLIVGWIAQTFLQLVLLPIIIVGQNIQAAAAEKRAVMTYEDAAAVLDEAVKIQKHLDHQDQSLAHLVSRLDEIEKKLPKR
ncbi:MAG: hypothetical protein RLZZ606_1156 [Actinomycetota bacterium]|jgi:uncharacterized membrane protein